MSALPLRDLIRVFARIGFLSFGGPAAQIALMHKELVQERRWMDEESFLRALSLCMLLPGPEAMQLATYAGWRMHGTLGGLIAGVLFVLPGALVILVLALGYATYGDVPFVQAAFVGVKAAVIIIVLQALLKVARKALIDSSAWVIAFSSFCAVFFVGLPFPIIVLSAALYGAFARRLPDKTPAPAIDSAPRALHTIAIWGGLWAAPILVLAVIDQGFLLQMALFFSKLAVVTFGGAYAVLAYMTQTVVTDFGWISTAEMIDALGLAETTPGPLILVTQFVAMLAGYAQDGPGLALAAGAITLWVTFTPCFLWIFLAGPYLDHLGTRPRLAAALSTITAAVVGVILNLAIWFAIHVLFTSVTTGTVLATPIPDPASLNVMALFLTAIAGLLMLVFKRSMIETLLILAVSALGLSLI